jgi:hypothetical protein
MSAQPEKQDTTAAKPDGEHAFFYRGEEISGDSRSKFKVLLPYAHDVDLKQGEAFSEEQELLEWVTGRQEEAVVRGLWDRLQRVRALAEDEIDVDRLISRRRRSLERIVGDMRELAEETGLPIDSSELFSLATRPAHPLEMPVFDPVSFFTGTGSSGFLPFTNWLPLGAGFWRLAWFGWSNLPRSWRYSGWVWAFDGEFWNGASVLSGWFPFGYGPLSSWGMDRRVSSAFVA